MDLVLQQAIRYSTKGCQRLHGLIEGCVATLKGEQNWDEGLARTAISGSQIEELLDESDLTEDIRSAHPPNLSLPDHVHRLITLNRPPRRLEFSKFLLGVDAAFDRSVVLLENVVQVLYGSVPTARRSTMCPIRSRGSSIRTWHRSTARPSRT